MSHTLSPHTGNFYAYCQYPVNETFTKQAFDFVQSKGHKFMKTFIETGKNYLTDLMVKLQTGDTLIISCLSDLREVPDIQSDYEKAIRAKNVIIVCLHVNGIWVSTSVYGNVFRMIDEKYTYLCTELDK